MARARLTRFFMPPESSFGIMSSTPSSPTRCSLSWTISLMSASLSFVCSRRPKATFSPTVIESNSAEYWKTMPILRRTLLSSASLIGTMSCPSMRIWPLVGLMRPMSRRRNVLLPEPEPLMMASVSPSRIVRLMCLSASLSSKRMQTSLNSIIVHPPHQYSRNVSTAFSRKMTIIEATTVFVVARPTPSAPSGQCRP